jgi:hypothetical protein
MPLCYIIALKNLSSPPQLQITRAAITSLAKPSFINILCKKTHLKILYKLNLIYNIFPYMYPAPVRLTGSLWLYDMPTLSGSQEVPTSRLLLRLDNTPPHRKSPPGSPLYKSAPGPNKAVSVESSQDGVSLRLESVALRMGKP